MGLEIGIALFEKVFFYTSFLSQYWIGQAVIILATLAIITRKAGDWKTLALPVMAGWQIFGMRLPWAFYAIAGMVFVLDTLSLKAVEGALGTVSDSLGFRRGILTRQGREYRRLKRMEGRVDVKKELQRLSDVDAEGIRMDFSPKTKKAIKRYDEMKEERKRRRDTMKKVEDQALEKAYKKKYFPRLWEEEKKKKSSKPKEQYLE